MSYKKKLIEVALPLEDINGESAREKSISRGHPVTLHLWWARRPLAACRAVLFASMVDDPSEHPELFPTEEDQDRERERLFDIIRDLVKWENVNNEKVLERARREIRRYAPDGIPPPVLDPFAGGGSIPLEAQRLGLEAHAGDLNPVAVLINKALIEIPPKFAGQLPVHPNQDPSLFKKKWKGAQGLAADVHYYGKWIRNEAEKRIGHLYPKVTINAEVLAKRTDLKASGYREGDELAVIAWLWARTVPSPNPAARSAHVPLVRSFWLSKKKGKQAWVEPIVDRTAMTYQFEIRTGQGTPQDGTRTRDGANCLLTGAPMTRDYIREQAQAGNMKQRLLAIVAGGVGGRVYFAPGKEHEHIAYTANPIWRPAGELSGNRRHSTPPDYGMSTFGDLFTDRQLVALTHFVDLVSEARARVRSDAETVSHADPQGYADAVATYLAMALDRVAMTGNSLVRWNSVAEKAEHIFGRQAIPMLWDFAETNFFGTSTGSLITAVELEVYPLSYLGLSPEGKAIQADATKINDVSHPVLVSTDPPYYDNVPYADLGDFFYVWLRRTLGNVHPNLFGTMLTPKASELVADPFRHGGKDEARHFFEVGLGAAFSRVRNVAHHEYPVTIFYAFKQAESDSKDGMASTGWETMLAGLVDAGFSITGTWPMRTEMKTRMRNMNSNALASSIVLVCRPRPTEAPRATRGGFIKNLRRDLPEALRELQHGNIAPVDLAQASIGPGMAVYSRYREVLETDGSSMTIRTALSLINQVLDEFLAEQEGEYDPDTRWALAWYDQYGFEEGKFGVAETLSKAKNTAVHGMVEAGIIASSSGTVRLLQRAELDDDWDPVADARLTVWETVQHLICALEKDGETAAARLVTRLRQRSAATADAARDLAYRLYNLCERKQRAKEALSYNGLIVAWPQIEKLAQDEQAATPVQGDMFG